MKNLNSPVIKIKESPISISVGQTAAITGLGLTSIWKLIREKKLRVVRIGRRTLVLFDSIEALLGTTRQMPNHRQ